MLGLNIAYCVQNLTSFSFIRSRDLFGAHQNLNGSRDLIMPLSGMAYHPGASTCYDQRTCQIWSL